MKENKLGQEPAFAACSDTYGNDGMSKRFYAACAAMQGLSVNHLYANTHGSDPKKLIKTAYELADELLKQEDL